MKKYFILFFLFFTIACSSTSKKEANFVDWYGNQLPKIDSGLISATSLHEEAYRRAEKLDTEDINSLKKFLAKMIPLSRKYDSGDITLSDYKDTTRIYLHEMKESSLIESQTKAAERRARYCAITGKC